jgi:thymidylate synthase
MNIIDRKYLDIIETIIVDGQDVQSRNSKTRRITNPMITFDSTPLISIRRTAWKQALREMEWFLSGSNDIYDLHKSVRHWWEPWANKRKVPSNYGVQFRDFSGHYTCIDQIDQLIFDLRNNPFSRRNVITTWNSADMIESDTPITNCHGTVIQCYVNPDNTVDMTMYQRSADLLLGVPHNFIQYWAFLHYLAHQSGRKVGKFTWIGGDTHIYKAHLEMAHKMIKTPVSHVVTPELIYNPTSDDFKADDFSLKGEYKPLIKESLELIV